MSKKSVDVGTGAIDCLKVDDMIGNSIVLKDKDHLDGEKRSGKEALTKLNPSSQRIICNEGENCENYTLHLCIKIFPSRIVAPRNLSELSPTFFFSAEQDT